MSELFLLALLMGSSASAQLLGTTGSFAESSYCKKYTCEFQGKSPLGANVSRYSYLVGKLPANFNPMQDYDMRTEVQIYRLSNKIISGTFSYGAQDTMFMGSDSRLNVYTDFVGLLTGTKPTVAQMGKIEAQRCGMIEDDGQAIVTNFASKYGIGCVNALGMNHRILTYSIFKL